MEPLAVLDDPSVAQVALDPVRSRLLGLLAREPASAAALAAAVDLPRQKVRYHLQALAERGLVHEVAQRRHGGLVERVFAPSAAAYVVSPAALGDAAADPARVDDRLPAAYLVAVAARAVREVGALARGAARARKRLPTLSLDAELRFASAADRAAFTDELAAVVRTLAARYHDESAPQGRWYRLAVLAHPRPDPNEEQTP